VSGVVAGLAAWWLAPGDFGKHAIVVAAAIAVVGLVSQLLRKTGIWRSKRIGTAFIAAQVLAAIAALLVFVLDDADVLRAVVMAAAVVVVAPLTLMLADSVRAWVPRQYRYVLLGALLAVAAVAIWGLDEPWWRAVATAAVIVAFGLLVLTLGHLHFLNAFSLFYRPDMRTGSVSTPEAEKALASPTPGAAGEPPEARTRRIANMVHPGSSHPHGPLHRFISEIFDKNDPPLYKNFLRVDVASDGLTITCFHATGTERGPADVTPEEPIPIDFPEATS
jgi:hypothetical protein